MSSDSERETRTEPGQGKEKENERFVEEEDESGEASSSSAAAEQSSRVLIVDALKSSPLYGQVSDVLHWRDPLQSALLFGIGNFFFFLITVGEYSVLTLLCYLALSLIFVCCAYANGTMLRAQLKKEKPENPFLPKLRNPYVATRETLEPHADAIVQLANDAATVARAILYFTDNALTFKVALFIWVLSVIGRLFSGLTLLYMTFIAAFIWPRIYLEKKKDIDRVFYLVEDKVSEVTALIKAKIPLGKKKKTE
ncbi:Reticulon-3 [Balamuthia mandrillaris]